MTLDSLEKQLEGDDLLVVQGTDPLTMTSRPPNSPFYLLLQQIDAADPEASTNERVVKIESLALAKAEAIADRVQGVTRKFVCTQISNDFFLIAMALHAGISDPWLNAVWLVYKSGRLWSEDLTIDGELQDLINVPREEARRLVDAASGGACERPKTMTQASSTGTKGATPPLDSLAKQLEAGELLNFPGTGSLTTTPRGPTTPYYALRRQVKKASPTASDDDRVRQIEANAKARVAQALAGRVQSSELEFVTNQIGGDFQLIAT